MIGNWKRTCPLCYVVFAVIEINGGNIYINADGDGLDSNGRLIINGGEIYVDGPENNGNGALDCGINATINGGILVAAG